MATVKWKQPFSFTIPVISLVVLLVILPYHPSQSQWISYRGGRNSNLWHPNMPANPRQLRHSHPSGSGSNGNGNGRSSSGNSRPIDHRSGNPSHNNFYTIHSPKEGSSPQGGSYHPHQSQPRYSSADFGRREQQQQSSSSSSGKQSSSRSSSSPTSASHQQQRSMSQNRDRDQNNFSHRHLPMSGHQQKTSNKVQWQQSLSKNGDRSRQDSTRRPVSQQAGHLLDSWPNTNTHHHLAPVPTTGASFKQNAKANFGTLKPEKWGNNVLVSNKPIELKKPMKPTAKQNQYHDDKKASDRQLVLPAGYPAKDKTAVANTINTLTKLSPKKPIFVFMRKEGILAVKAGADAGDVIKKLAGTSKLPFYNGTNALPSHSMPTVFLAPEDMSPPTGYGKIPIPNLKPKVNGTPRPTYTKILMPGGTHMKGTLVTTSTTTPAPPTTTGGPPLNPFGSPSSPSPAFDQLFQNGSVNNLSWEQKFHLLQLLQSQGNNPLADRAAMAILASASPPPLSASPSAPVPSSIAPNAPPSFPGLSPIVQGPTLALSGQGQWSQQMFQGQGPGGFLPGLPSSPVPQFGSSTTPAPLGSVSSSISPSPSGAPNGQGDQNDIHKLIGTIVESAVSNTVSTMLQHQRIQQQQNQPQHPLIGIGPPIHAPNLGGPSRGPPPPHHFGRGPPPPMRPPHGRFPFQQYQHQHPHQLQHRPPFPPSPTPGRFPPHPSAGPPPPGPPSPHPSAAAPPLPGLYPTQPNPSAYPPQPQQQFQQNPSQAPSQSPSPTAPTTPAPPQQQPGSPLPQYPFQQQQQQQQPNPSGPPPPFQFQQQQQQQFHQQQQQQFQQAQSQISQQRQGPLQHPFVPQFQPPPGYSVSSTPSPLQNSVSPQQFNPSSTAAPLQFQQQQQQQQHHQSQFPPQFNGGRQPPKQAMRMIERPFPNQKPRNPLQNALQFFGISTPRPDPANKSPSPSPTPGMGSSTPYPRPPFPPSPTPFGGRPGPGHPFPSSTPNPQNGQPSPFPYQQQQSQQIQQNLQQQITQQSQQNQQAILQHQHQQSLQQQQHSLQNQHGVQVGLQPGDGKGKKPTLIVQTPNGQSGKKNTYVITGGGQELPELNKIMKVLNDLKVDSENTPASPSPSSTTQHPTIFSPSPTPTPGQYSASRSPIPFSLRPTIAPNVMIKNANVGISPTPSQQSTGGVSSTHPPQQQFISMSTSTPAPYNPSSVRPHVMSSTQLPMSGVSPVMQIIKQIQSQIPGVSVSPSVETFAQKTQQHHQNQQQHQHHQQQHSARPILLSTPRPLASPSPTPSGILISSARPPLGASPSSMGPIMFSSPRPHHHQASPSPSPTPNPGQVIISSTGFPRVINVSPSAGDTPQSIHQAVVEAIMKQQAAESGGSPAPGQIVVTGGGRLSSAGPTPQYIEVIPAGGSIPGLGGNPSSKPFVVQLQSQQQHQAQPSSPSPSPIASHEENHHHLNLNDPNVRIQKGSLESHETYKENSRKPSQSGSVESGERRQPVYSRERYQSQSKTHHHSKEVSDEYPEKGRRPSFTNQRSSKEQYDTDEIMEQLNPNRRMYSGESSKQDLLSEESSSPSKSSKAEQEMEKLIEKIITEEKIVWKQGPGQGEMIPSKVRTQERILIRPSGSSKEVTTGSGDSEFSQRRTPLSSAELRQLIGSGSVEQPVDKSSSSSTSKELSPSNFAGILRSKMKFDKLMEKLYPSKQLVSPFTIQNNSANFHHLGSRPSSGEVVPTIASSLITTPSGQQFQMSSISPTLQSMIGSSLSGLVSASPTPDGGRFKIGPGEVSMQEPVPTGGQQQHQNILVGVSPSGQPIFMHSSPSSPTEAMPTSAQQPSSSSSQPQSGSTVEERLIFIPQGTPSSNSMKSNKPQILITTVDELPDLMAQLGGVNPEIRMDPDRATLEAELAKVGATSTASASTVKATVSTTATAKTNPPPPPPPPSPTKPAEGVQTTVPGMRRMDGQVQSQQEKAFTWRPAVNATVASPLSSTLSYDTSRRLVSGLGAGMLHAMSAGFGNMGNGAFNKFAWIGPSAIPPQLGQAQPTQIMYQMQNGIPLQNRQYQHQQAPGPSGAPLGYYGYKWANMLQEQAAQHQQAQPTAPPTSSNESSTKSPDYRLMYRSQYKEEELPISADKLQPVQPVHKLKKGGKVKARTRTTASPIDPVSVEEYEDDDEDDLEQEDLIPQDTLVPKHARGKLRHNLRDEQEESGEDDEESAEENPSRRRQDVRRNKSGNRRRRPGKLTEEDEEEEEEAISKKKQRSRVKAARPTKPTYDEEDDASPSPKQSRTKSHPKPNRRSDTESEEEDEEDEDYDVYDVKPALNVKRKKVTPTAQPTTTSTASSTTPKLSSKQKAIYVNREMFLVSGEERTKDGNPKAEPVYQPNQPGGKFPVLQAPSIISGQSVVKKTGSGSGSGASEEKPTTTMEPKTTAPSPTTSTTTTTTSKATTTTTKLPSTKATPTLPTKLAGQGKKKEELDDYKDAQDELRNLLKKIQDRLTAQDEVYDFGDDAALYDYYDEMHQVLSTKATTTTTTKATSKPKKKTTLKKGGKKNKKNKNKKKNKKNKNRRNKKKNGKKTTQKAVTKPIPTRVPVTTTTTEKLTSPTYVHHHQRHPVSSLEQFNSFEEKAQPPTTTTTTTTTTTSTTSAPPQSQSVEEVVSVEAAASGSLEQASNVAYVFSENAKDNRPKMKRRPLWVRRRVGGVATPGAFTSGEGQGLQPVRMPNGPNGKVIRLVRRRRPMGARRRMMQQRQQQYLQQQQEQQQQQGQPQNQPQNSFEQQPQVPSTTTAAPTTTSTQGSIEVAPPNYSSPPLEQYFEQNSLERRVGSSPDSTEGGNATAILKSPKRKLKLIRLKGQRAQWRLRLHGSGDEESSEGGPRPAALTAPREVSAPLPLQAPLPAPVFTSKGLHHQTSSSSSASSSTNSARAAKSAGDMIKHYTTSFSSESASSSVEARVCIRGKCQYVSRQ